MEPKPMDDAPIFGEEQQSHPSPPDWTYPTRMCRICREEVVPAVTMFPPGVPMSLQRPIIEYKNEDEYGRLIKPCRCRGGMRYIHELCLSRSRTLGVRQNSMFKCHECGYSFNFQRLTAQKYLSSKVASGTLTVMVMFTVMFFLGFVADPIINLYLDPYDTVMGTDYYYELQQINEVLDERPSWGAHFMKGLVSMGLVGFLKTILINPLQWWNFRNTGFMSVRSGRTTVFGTRSATGRDRAANISWIAILIGVASAFYFFYQWVQLIIGRILQRIGNKIVDTQLPGDDDDIKPPPGWSPPPPLVPQNAQPEENDPSGAEAVPGSFTPLPNGPDAMDAQTRSSVEQEEQTTGARLGSSESDHEDDPDNFILVGNTSDNLNSDSAYSSGLQQVTEQTWSFSDH